MVWEPEAYAEAVRLSLFVETDPAHRLWSYQSDQGFYTQPETEWAIHRAVSRLVGEGELPAPNKSSVARPAQGEEVVKVMKRRVPRIVPGEKNGKDLLACQNKTLDLSEPWDIKVVEHSPKHYLTGGLSHQYEPDAKCKQWEEFLFATIPDFDDQRLLAQYLGACLSSKVPPKGVIYLWGPADSGKSTICRTFTHLLGRQNVSVVGPHDLSEQRFAAADLFGKLANIVPDIPTEPVRNTSVYKQVTGGDMIRADIKYAAPLHFTSTAAILYSGNDLPKSFNDPSDGFYSRQISVHCPNKVAKPDPNLEPILQSEASGLLNWALTGLQDLYQNGWQYAVPQKTKDRQSADLEAANHELAWSRDRTIVVENEFLSRGEVYDDYSAWCEKQGLKPWSRPRLFGKLRDLWGLDTKRKSYGNTERGWWGHGIIVESLTE